MDGFTEVYAIETGIKHRVPVGWLDDPVLGRGIRKTPRQRALDGELGAAPTADSTVPEIRAFAKDAEVDISGLSKKDELLAAVYAAVGSEPLPQANADAGVAVEAPVNPDVDTPAGVPPTPTDDPPSEGGDSTPAAGAEGVS